MIFTYKRQKLEVIKDAYESNGATALYIINAENGEYYSDITVNIEPYFFENQNEVIIDDNLPKGILKRLEEIGLLQNTGKHARSGFCTYKVYTFNKDLFKFLP